VVDVVGVVELERAVGEDVRDEVSGRLLTPLEQPATSTNTATATTHARMAARVSGAIGFTW
jgi:hypothetical protein